MRPRAHDAARDRRRARRPGRRRDERPRPEARGGGADPPDALRDLRGRRVEDVGRGIRHDLEDVGRQDHRRLERHGLLDRVHAAGTGHLPPGVPRSDAAPDPGRPQVGPDDLAADLAGGRKPRGVQPGRTAHVPLLPRNEGRREGGDRQTRRREGGSGLDSARLPQGHRGGQRARLLEPGPPGRPRRQARLAEGRQRALRVREPARPEEALLRRQPLLRRELPRPRLRRPARDAPRAPRLQHRAHPPLRVRQRRGQGREGRPHAERRADGPPRLPAREVLREGRLRDDRPLHVPPRRLARNRHRPRRPRRPAGLQEPHPRPRGRLPELGGVHEEPPHAREPLHGARVQGRARPSAYLAHQRRAPHLVLEQDPQRGADEEGLDGVAHRAARGGSGLRQGAGRPGEGFGDVRRPHRLHGGHRAETRRAPACLHEGIGREGAAHEPELRQPLHAAHGRARRPLRLRGRPLLRGPPAVPREVVVPALEVRQREPRLRRHAAARRLRLHAHAHEAVHDHRVELLGPRHVPGRGRDHDGRDERAAGLGRPLALRLLARARQHVRPQGLPRLLRRGERSARPGRRPRERVPLPARRPRAAPGHDRERGDARHVPAEGRSHGACPAVEGRRLADPHGNRRRARSGPEDLQPEGTACAEGATHCAQAQSRHRPRPRARHVPHRDGEDRRRLHAVGNGPGGRGRLRRRRRRDDALGEFARRPATCDLPPDARDAPHGRTGGRQCLCGPGKAHPPQMGHLPARRPQRQGARGTRPREPRVLHRVGAGDDRPPP